MESIALSGLFLLSIWGVPQPVSAEPIPIPIETIEQKIERVAIAHNIATTSLYNLVMSESSLNPLKVGDMEYLCKVGVNLGKPIRAKGLVQITDCYEPNITDEQAFDPEWALNWAADKIVKGEAWKTWTVANCYSFSKLQVPNLPAMKDIQPNTTIPRRGEIAIFYYKGKKHIGVQDEILKDGFFLKEANYEPYKIGRRFIKWNDPALAGLYSPDIGSSPD